MIKDMSNTKHTPGEGYFFPKYKGELTTEIKFGDKTVAEILGYISSEGEIDKEEAIANAKLIAAAPELLEMLQNILASEPLDKRIENEMKELIKKATD